MPPLSVPPGRARPPRGLDWLRAHRGVTAGGAAFVLAIAVYPWAVGGLAARLFASRVTTRLGRPVSVGAGRAGLGHITLTDIRVAGTTGDDLVDVDRVVVPFGVAVVPPSRRAQRPRLDGRRELRREPVPRVVQARHHRADGALHEAREIAV